MMKNKIAAHQEAHVVVGNDNIIYGVYSTEADANKCKEYVENSLNVTCVIRYFIIDKNFADFK